MGRIPSEHYWEAHKSQFPYQCEVPHMSASDIDPRVAQQKISFHFLRVPFNNVSHWGFMSETHLEAFKKLAGLEK